MTTLQLVQAAALAAVLVAIPTVGVAILNRAADAIAGALQGRRHDRQ